eukprot:398797-Hanusia_phi.AAC.1
MLPTDVPVPQLEEERGEVVLRPWSLQGFRGNPLQRQGRGTPVNVGAPPLARYGGGHEAAAAKEEAYPRPSRQHPVLVNAQEGLGRQRRFPYELGGYALAGLLPDSDPELVFEAMEEEGGVGYFQFALLPHSLLLHVQVEKVFTSVTSVCHPFCSANLLPAPDQRGMPLVQINLERRKTVETTYRDEHAREAGLAMETAHLLDAEPDPRAQESHIPSQQFVQLATRAEGRERLQGCAPDNLAPVLEEGLQIGEQPGRRKLESLVEDGAMVHSFFFDRRRPVEQSSADDLEANSVLALEMEELLHLLVLEEKRQELAVDSERNHPHRLVRAMKTFEKGRQQTFPDEMNSDKPHLILGLLLSVVHTHLIQASQAAGFHQLPGQALADRAPFLDVLQVTLLHMLEDAVVRVHNPHQQGRNSPANLPAARRDL